MNGKRDNIMPICKNGNKEEPLNYKPVSLISIVYKICEKVIKKQWTDFLEREGTIPQINNLDSEQEDDVSKTY